MWLLAEGEVHLRRQLQIFACFVHWRDVLLLEAARRARAGGFVYDHLHSFGVLFLLVLRLIVDWKGVFFQAVSGIALPSASDKLYSGGKDGTVRLWDCQTGQVTMLSIIFFFL